MIREIKWAWQRVVRGYDDRIFWEFDSYFNQFIPAVKDFCESEISEMDEEYKKLNPQRYGVYTKTLELANEVENAPLDDFYKEPNTTTTFWEYFGKNITIYWN